MDVIFERAITEDGFNAVIAIASTNTAPSPTGFTFNMIKKWPEEVKKRYLRLFTTCGQQKKYLHNGNGSS